MRRNIVLLGLCAAILSPSRGARGDQTFNVDTAVTWAGFMNVYELPINGGGYVFGSPWGTRDLVAKFNALEDELTLAPNSVDDPDPFWYLPSGGPGSTGNKITEANFYVEHNSMFAGETITFEGNVLSNTLTTSHVARAFIKDFAPDYSSFFIEEVVLTPGPFSVSLLTDSGAGRHVQYGFSFTGPCVWITDVGPYGTVKVEAIPSTPGDFDGNEIVDGRDFLLWQRDGMMPPVHLDPEFLEVWEENYGVGGLSAVSAVPEPAGVLLMALAASAIAVRGRRYLA